MNKLFETRRCLGLTPGEAATACSTTEEHYLFVEGGGFTIANSIDRYTKLIIEAHGEPCPYCKTKVANCISEPDPAGSNRFVLHCGCLTPKKPTKSRDCSRCATWALNNGYCCPDHAPHCPGCDTKDCQSWRLNRVSCVPDEQGALSPEEAVAFELAAFEEYTGRPATTSDRRVMADFLLAQAAAMLPMDAAPLKANDRFLCINHTRNQSVGLEFTVDWVENDRVRLSAEGIDTAYSISVYVNSIRDPRKWERVQ